MSFNGVLSKCCSTNCWTSKKNRVNFVKMTGDLWQTLRFAIISSLLQHGYMESNPAPVYNIGKVALGSFYQGETRCLSTGGVQCVCNVILALCWSNILDSRIWQKDKLDHVLNIFNF